MPKPLQALLLLGLISLLLGAADRVLAAPLAPPQEGSGSAGTARPWRLERTLKLPDWLHLSVTHRTRYADLQNQYRPFRTGDDRALSLRTNLLLEVRLHSLSIGVEVLDSRLYLADDNALLSTALVNPLDLLQAYVGAEFRNVISDGSRLRLRAGRQTMDVGSRRLVARNVFRNTINAFTGLDLEWTGRNQNTVRAFVTVPVDLRVASLRDNEMKLDRERTETVLWGVFFGSHPLSHEVRAEAYALGLHERDSERFPTSNRSFVTPGLRVSRPGAPGRVDLEVEAVVQVGSSRFTILPEDTTDLSHRAFFFHGAFGRSFASAWQPRLVFMYDYGSGDRDPYDETNHRFDTLYGGRRFEFGPTGIYGAFTRENISSPSLRLEAQPNADVSGFVAYRPAWLASARDLWTTTLIWDPSGESGRFLGHQVEGRLRWEAIPENIRLEGGFAHLWLGGFPKRAPNGIRDGGNPLYVYFQVIFSI